jgi:PAS domain S-box-containing protein
MPKKTKARLPARNKPSPKGIAARKRTNAKYAKQSKEEERLRQSEERFAAFMDNLPGYAWMKDLQGRYVYVNHAVKGLPGYRSLKKTDAQIWPADLAAEYRSHDQQVIAAKRPLHTVEHFVLRGRQRYMVGTKFPIFDKTGEVALVGGTGVDITERIEAEQALRASTERLQALTRRLVELQEAERRDISRELHDRVGQTLTAMRINMEIIRDRLGRHDDAEIRARNDDSLILIASAFDAVENVMDDLRPPMLDELGLLAPLRWYAKKFADRTGIRLAVTGDGDARARPEVELALFRIAQEALTNIARHARATIALIDVRRPPNATILTIEDDGVGIRDAQRMARPGYGMIGMRERAESVGGTLEAVGRAPHGTRITVSVPK